jgi:hypothetical protein
MYYGMGKQLPIMLGKLPLARPLGWDKQGAQHNGQPWAYSMLKFVVNDYDNPIKIFYIGSLWIIIFYRGRYEQDEKY